MTSLYLEKPYIKPAVIATLAVKCPNLRWRDHQFMFISTFKQRKVSRWILWIWICTSIHRRNVKIKELYFTIDRPDHNQSEASHLVLAGGRHDPRHVEGRGQPREPRHAAHTRQPPHPWDVRIIWNNMGIQCETKTDFIEYKRTEETEL